MPWHVLEPCQTDTLRLYLQEIKSHPLLSQREEQELLYKIKVEHSKEALDYLVFCNQRLVVVRAKKFYSTRLDLMDRIQEGNIGLIKAIEHIDLEKHGVNKLNTYAVWWIDAYIRRAVQENSFPCCIPQHILDLLFKIKRQIDDYLLENGDYPTTEELCRRFDKSPEEIGMLLEIMQPAYSLDRPIGEDGESTLVDLLPDPASLEFACERNIVIKDMVDRLISHLPPKYRVVIMLRFGLIDGSPKSLAQIGNMVGLSRESIRLIEAEAMRELRKHFSEGGAFFYSM